MTPTEEARLCAVEERARRAEERLRDVEDRTGMHWRRMEDMEDRAGRQIAEIKKDVVDMMIVHAIEMALIVFLLFWTLGIG